MVAPPARGSGNRFIAAGLAILLGTFGAHKFYMGKIAQGFVYLLFCWTGVPQVVGIIEGIVYIVQGEERFRRENSY